MNRKKTITGILVIIILFSVSVFVYQFVSDKIKQRQSAIQERAFTEAEKLLKRQINEIDLLREQYKIQNNEQATTSAQSQIKSTDTLRNKTLKQETIQIKKTTNQQLRELEALR